LRSSPDINLTKDNFSENYWNELYGWYERGGYENVAAYLAQFDLANFDPKAPPKKTPAFWSIVDSNRAPEDADLADVLDELCNPDVITLRQIVSRCEEGDFKDWLKDRKNRRAIPHRLETADYVPVRNPDRPVDGLWKIGGKRQAVYGLARLADSRPDQGGAPVDARTLKALMAVKMYLHYFKYYRKNNTIHEAHARARDRNNRDRISLPPLPSVPEGST